jgi:hypothetical protein
MSEIMSFEMTGPMCSGIGAVRRAWNESRVPLPPIVALTEDGMAYA